MGRHSVATAAAFLLAAVADAAPPAWIEVRSAHFTVVGDGGDRAARHVAWQFEQIRSGLSGLWPWARIEGRPFLVFAARDEATLRALGPQYWEGKRYRPTSFWTSGRDRRYVALRTDIREPDAVSDNPYQTAYWCYADAVFSGAFPRRLPLWYQRGVAEVMSNTFVREKELHVGRPLRSNLRVLNERPAIPLAEFLAVDRRSPWFTQESRIQLFDAQAWAFVHYLMFGEEGRYAARLDRFNRLLFAGAEEGAALEEAFGKDLRPLFDGMLAYVSRRLFSFAKVALSLDAKPEAFSVRTLSAPEAAVVRGELLVAMGRPVEARALAAEAAAADATLPGPSEIEAALQDRDDHRDEARVAYAKAVDAGSKSAYAHYRLAQLEWRQGGDKALWEKLAARLEASRALDPTSANALSFLAEVRTSLGQADEALALAKRAVELDPGDYYHRLALARVLWSMQLASESIRAAETALEAADDDSERQQVRSFLDFAQRTRQP